MLGYYFQPRLRYQPSQVTRLEVGAHLLQYHGDVPFREAMPYFTFQWAVSPSLDIVMGTLYGGVQHGLPEPLYRFDRHFQEQFENGLQLLWHKGRFQADTWADWESFILPGADFQEQFFWGHSHRFRLTGAGGAVAVHWLGTLSGIHRGGQINQSGGGGTVTQANISLGARVASQAAERLLGWGFEAYWLGFSHSSGPNPYPADSGSGVYLLANGQWRSVNMLLGYWQANNMAAPKGEYLFLSASDADDGSYFERSRRVVSHKIIGEKNIEKGLMGGARLESYFDLDNSRLDYAYSVYLRFSSGFLLKKDVN